MPYVAFVVIGFILLSLQQQSGTDIDEDGMSGSL